MYMIFAKRNLRELLRDPLSYVFCLGLPLVMLVIFIVISRFSGGHWLSLLELSTGITVFSYSFTMLYTTLLVSKDRSTSFLKRLYASPMKSKDFVIGYAAPGLIIAVGQAVICSAAALLLGVVTGSPLSAVRMLTCIAVTLPAAVMFVGFGILFGSLFGEKSAPGISSIIISASGFLSGAWMPLESMGVYGTVCSFLPFYPPIKAARTVLGGKALTPDGFLLPFAVSLCYAAVVFTLAVVVFGRKTSADGN
ncbi:MAG: ABC transporter permease [Eubacteriales bacterium]